MNEHYDLEKVKEIKCIVSSVSLMYNHDEYYVNRYDIIKGYTDAIKFMEEEIKRIRDSSFDIHGNIVDPFQITEGKKKWLREMRESVIGVVYGKVFIKDTKDYYILIDKDDREFDLAIEEDDTMLNIVNASIFKVLSIKRDDRFIAIFLEGLTQNQQLDKGDKIKVFKTRKTRVIQLINYPLEK